MPAGPDRCPGQGREGAAPAEHKSARGVGARGLGSCCAQSPHGAVVSLSQRAIYSERFGETKSEVGHPGESAAFCICVLVAM